MTSFGYNYDIAKLQVRLMLWNATTNAKYRPLLTAQNISLSAAVNEIGALSFDLNMAALEPSLSQFITSSTNLEVSLEYSPYNGAWFEPVNCRFVLSKLTVNAVEPENQTYKYEFLSYAAIWRRVVTMFPAGSWATDDAGKRKNTRIMTGNPGYIISTLVNEAKAAYSLPGVMMSFGNNATSTGVAWASNTTITIEIGPGDIMSILELLVDQGVCEYTFQARMLNLYNPQGAGTGVLGSDKSATAYWRNGFEVFDAPTTMKYDDIIGNVYVINPDTGGIITQNLGGSNATPWGALAMMVESPSSDLTTAQQLATTVRQANSQVKRTLTKRFNMQTLNIAGNLQTTTPIVDVQLGDTVTTESVSTWISGRPSRFKLAARVIAMTLTKTDDNLTIEYQLGDRSYTDEVRMTRLLKRLASRVTKKK